MIKEIYISVLLIILLLCFIFLFTNMFLPVPFVPSSLRISRKMLEAAEITSTDVVYDLGSGDGRLVIMAAKKGAKYAVGFDINPVLIFFSKIRARLMRLKNTTFILKSIFAADLTQCDKLFVYMSPRIMKDLEPKILKEMKPGSLVISNSFSFKDMEPIRVIDKQVKVYKVQG